MKSMIKSSLSYILCSILIFFSLPIEVVYAKNTTETASKIKIESIEGNAVVINASGKEITARENMNLYSGYQIKTESKSYVYISLDESKAIKLDALSEIEIRKSGKKLELYVITGNLFFNVQEKLTAEETLSVKTSNMSMGIRGTSGMIGRSTDQSQEKNIAQIYDGTVQITMPAEELIRKYNAENTDNIADTDEFITNYLNGIPIVELKAGNQMEFILPAESDKTGEVNMNKLSEQDIKGFVGQEIKNNSSLQERIKKDTELSVNEIIQNADENLKKEEQIIEEKRQTLISTSIQSTASSVIISNNSSSTSSESSKENNSQPEPSLQDLIVSCKKGTKIGTTQISAMPIAGGKLYYSVTTEDIKDTIKENQLVLDVNELISDINIIAPINSYINIYELNNNNKVKAFAQVLVNPSILKTSISNFTFDETLTYQGGSTIILNFLEPDAEELKTLEGYLIREGTNIATVFELKNAGILASVLNEKLQIPTNIEKGSYQIYFVDTVTNTFIGNNQIVSIVPLSDILPTLEIKYQEGTVLGSFRAEVNNITGSLYYNIIDTIPASLSAQTNLDTDNLSSYQTGEELMGVDYIGKFFVVYEYDEKGNLKNYNGIKITMEILKKLEIFSIPTTIPFYTEGDIIRGINFANDLSTIYFYMSQNGELSTYQEVEMAYPLQKIENLIKPDGKINLSIDVNNMTIKPKAGEYYIYCLDTQSKTFIKSENTFLYIIKPLINSTITANKGSQIGTTQIFADAKIGEKLYYSVTKDNIEDTLKANDVILGLNTLETNKNIPAAINSYINIYELDKEYKLKSFGKILVTENILKTTPSSFSFDAAVSYTKEDSISLTFSEPDAEEIENLLAYLVPREKVITSLEEIKQNGISAAIDDNRLYLSEVVELGEYYIYMVDPDTDTFIGNNQILHIKGLNILPTLEVNYIKGTALGSFCAKVRDVKGSLYYQIADEIPASLALDTFPDINTMVEYSSGNEIIGADSIGQYIIIYECNTEGKIVNYNGREITMQMLKCPKSFSINNSFEYKKNDIIIIFKGIPTNVNFYMSQDGTLSTYDEIENTYPLNVMFGKDILTNADIVYVYVDIDIIPAELKPGKYYVYYLDTNSRTFTRSSNTFTYIDDYPSNPTVKGEKSIQIGAVKMSASAQEGGKLYYSVTTENIEKYLEKDQIVTGLNEFISGSNISASLNSYINIYELDEENKLKTFGKVLVTQNILKTKPTAFLFNETLSYSNNDVVPLTFREQNAPELETLEAYLVKQNINITSLEEIKNYGIPGMISDKILYISEITEPGKYHVYLVDPITDTFIGNNLILNIKSRDIEPTLSVEYTKGSSLGSFCIEITSPKGNLYYEIADEIPDFFDTNAFDIAALTPYYSGYEITAGDYIGKFVIIYECNAEGELLNYNGKEITMQMLKCPSSFWLDGSSLFSMGDTIIEVNDVPNTAEFYMSQEEDLSSIRDIKSSYILKVSKNTSSSDVFATVFLELDETIMSESPEPGKYYIYYLDTESNTFTRSENSFNYVIK